MVLDKKYLQLFFCIYHYLLIFILFCLLLVKRNAIFEGDSKSKQL